MPTTKSTLLTSTAGWAAPGVLACLLGSTVASAQIGAPVGRPVEAAPSPGNAPASAPAAAAGSVINDNHPIIVAGVGLIGGCKDGEWLKVESVQKTYKGKAIDPNYNGPAIVVDMPLLRGGETYRLYSSQGVVGSGTGSKVTFQVDGAGNVYYRVKIRPSAKGTRKWRFAINGDWDAMPRPLKVNKKGYTVDVDGDGREETIRVQTRSDRPTKGGSSGQSGSEEGSEENAKVVTFTLEMNGKSTRLAQLTIDGTYAEQYEVAAIDLNGDGWLEFVFTTSGHNDSLKVVDVTQGKARTVLSSYSGD